jgi:hypothetical protein
MHKIVIIEDRTARKEKFLNRSILIELEKFKPDILFLEGTDYTKLKSELDNDELDFLTQFSVIITHRSAFEHALLDKIKDHCKKSKKPLVFFSGGISTSYYDETNFHFLTINSKDFYSNNLIYFLKKVKEGGDIELPILQYGVNWELNYLMEARNSISSFIYSNPGMGQVTRNVIENEIKLKGKVLKALKNRFGEITWIDEGIKEDATEKLKNVLLSIKSEIDDYIKKL